MSEPRRIYIGEIGECPQNIEAFRHAIDGAGRLHLVFDSPGGCATLAFEMFTALRGRNVTAEVRRRCFSAGMIVLMAAQEISLGEDALLMIHPAHTQAIGSAAYLRMKAKHLDAVDKRIAAILAERCELPVKTTRAWSEGPADRYFTSQEAVALGLADRILPADKPKRKRKLAAFKVQEPTRTDAEELFWSVLRAFPSLEVKNRASFHRDLALWLTCNVRDSACSQPCPQGASEVLKVYSEAPTS